MCPDFSIRSRYIHDIGRCNEVAGSLCETSSLGALPSHLYYDTHALQRLGISGIYTRFHTIDIVRNLEHIQNIPTPGIRGSHLHLSQISHY